MATLVTRLLDAADVARAPLVGEPPLVDLARCTESQRAAIETIVRCERFWHAIPFLTVLGDHHLPSLDLADARQRLGV